MTPAEMQDSKRPVDGDGRKRLTWMRGERTTFTKGYRCGLQHHFIVTWVSQALRNEKSYKLRSLPLRVSLIMDVYASSLSKDPFRRGIHEPKNQAIKPHQLAINANP